MRRIRKIRCLDDLAFLQAQCGHCLPDSHLLFFAFKDFATLIRVNRCRGIIRVRIDALAPLLMSQPVNGPRPCLVHDPAQDRAIGSVILRSSPPNVVKDVERQFFSGLPVVGNSHDQGEYDSMRSLKQRLQGRLVTRGDRLDEPDPLASGIRALDVPAKSRSPSVRGASSCGPLSAIRVVSISGGRVVIVGAHGHSMRVRAVSESRHSDFHAEKHCTWR